jgi:hypothetical protein
MGISCVDVLLLHCPEFVVKGGVDIEDVYAKVERAFAYLETEVQRGRIAYYGVTAAFYPLRPSDPEHLSLQRLLALEPAGGHFRVIQFPLNFAEPQALWEAHVPRDASGAALGGPEAGQGPSLTELARSHGLATLSNRPLDGLYKEVRGVLRFASDTPMNGELAAEDQDTLEAKLVTLCPGVGDRADPVTEELAGKTLKVLASVGAVDCVLVGMRQPRYVLEAMGYIQARNAVSSEDALQAVRVANNAVAMWFCMAREEDHGTAKDWRLPTRPTELKEEFKGA